MQEIILSIPEETSSTLKLAPERVGEEIRLAAAIKFYELGKLSSGAAARLADLPRVIFLTKLAEYGVDTFRLSEEELLEDLTNA